MVKSVDHVTLDTVVEVSQVADHTGDRVHLTAYGNLNHVVVAVAKRIIAFAEHSPILFRGETRVVIIV
jgi:hypothetical protein